MIKPLLVATAVLASAGCKKKVPAATPPPPTALDAAILDAEVAPPDEDTLRAGKRTGLGGPDETPEVATEDFARALITGATPWSRVVSPSAGVVELRVAPDRFLGRRCGPAVDASLARLGTEMAQQLTAPGFELLCDNSGLAGAPPQSALCSIDGDSPYALGYDLVFVPDPTLGLRLVGFTTIDGETLIDAFDLEIAKTGKLCP